MSHPRMNGQQRRGQPLRAPRSDAPKRRPVWQRKDHYREGASRLARSLFPGNLKLYASRGDLSMSSLSRARNEDHSNAAYRCAEWLVALREAGVPKDVAMLVPLWLMGVLHTEYSDRPTDFDAALWRHEYADAAEDVADQPVKKGDRSPEALRAFIAAVAEEEATAREARLAGEALLREKTA